MIDWAKGLESGVACLRDMDAEAAVQAGAAEANEDAAVDGRPRRAPAARAVRALAVLRPPQEQPQGLSRPELSVRTAASSRTSADDRLQVCIVTARRLLGSLSMLP